MPSFKIRETLHAPKLYLTGRSIASFVALMFAFYYSDALGPERRSILTFSLVICLFFSAFFISPVAWDFRNLACSKEYLPRFSLNYATRVAKLSLVVSLLSCLLLGAYGVLVYTIPSTFFIVISLYSFWSSVAFGLQDYWVKTDKFNHAFRQDLQVILSQIVFFIALSVITDYSISVSIILSMTFSYIIQSLEILHTINKSNKSYVVKDELEKKSFYKRIRLVYVPSVAVALSDRLDKIIIAFFLPLPVLAQYSVMVSFFTFWRFFIDSYAKLSGVGLMYWQTNFSRTQLGLRLGFLVVTTTSYGVVVIHLIETVLGPEWILPHIFYYLFALAEVVRSFFIVKLTNLVNNFQYSSSILVSTLHLFLFAVLSAALVPRFALLGAFFAILISSLVAIYVKVRND